ncbi:Lichenan permease IIC component [bioreactor metagenome]|uniref:Lichenan permease IIC component n=1 Tax=bioreactor metagenome TaxID=1076179 RepID=A0A644XE76_9ZZZZ
MNKIIGIMDKYVAPIGNKVGNNKVLNVISTALTMVLPMIILGSMFTLINSFQIEQYQNFLSATGLGDLLSLVPKFTVDLLAVYVSFTAAYAYVHKSGMSEDSVSAGLISILAFFVLTPLTSIEVDGRPIQLIPFEFLGSKGLFTALITGIIVGLVYTLVVKKGWTIKMPEGVPQFVAKSFNALIPAFIIAIVFLTINGVFNSLTALSFNEWLYSILEMPLSKLSGNLGTHLFLTFLASLFWFLGLHGGQITGPFMMMLFMEAGIENQAAYAAGQPMGNILTLGLGGLLLLGGIGTTIGLSINLLLFSKSSRYKSLGKLAILPSIFGINEPLIFGMPMILNPMMMIPFFLVPQIINVLTYLVMKIGLVGLPRLAMFAAGTPILLDGALMSGISGVVWQLLMIILSVAIYYPFFKFEDNKALKEETIN